MGKTNKTRYWITSDTHFGHEAIIDFCDRPFKTVEEMDEALIKNWNDRVGVNDFVLHLGDFAFVRKLQDFDKYFYPLNGRIILVRGNHDRYTKKMQERYNIFYEYHHSGQYQFKLNKQKYFLNHYPMISWDKSFHGAVHFFGHVHSQNGFTFNSDVDQDHPDRMRPFLCQANSYDCGVDNNNYQPILLEDAVKKARSPLHKLTTGPI